MNSLDQTKSLSVSYETLVRFFEATEGNYRNAFYICCSVCRYCREEGCGDFLFIPGHDCLPILIPLADAKSFLGSVDRSDCAGTLSNSAFLQMYHQWLMLQTASEESCPFHQILHLTNP